MGRHTNPVSSLVKVCTLSPTTQFIPSPPPPPYSHTLSVHIHGTFSLGRGGDGGQREWQQYTIIVPSSMGATVHKLVRKYHHEWMYLQSIKSVKHNAAKSIYRSILKKSRHIGFGVAIVHSSMAWSNLVLCPHNMKLHVLDSNCLLYNIVQYSMF